MTSRVLRPLVLNSKQIAPRLSIQYPAAFRLLSSQSVKMADRVHRITMFKLPSEESQKKLIEEYKTLKENNRKDGQPYILSIAAGPAEPDQRSQGFTFVSKSEFASLEDMKYYDEECVAHQALKKVAMTLGVEGIMTVYFKPQVVGGVAP
ncbi:Stress-response A/B barrel domain-containing protein [Trichoderma simmonsii]|uniref:Stress-response A/B barrel domain-containing protein n=1 Tax=Trichoderma simmonsii TaxID=1491479 RepID=A0A8G0PLA6_9HYPO|nr:Stress-response A/B barrel domain-containing protein [Trichoderma simmonsii]